MNDEPPQWARELKAQLDRMETRFAELTGLGPRLNRIETMLTAAVQPAPAPSASVPFADLLTPEEAMTAMKYKDRSSFMLAVRRDRIPVVKLNARCFRFDPSELQKWKSRKEQKKSRFAL